MGIIDDFFDGMKGIFEERDKSVRVRKFLYNKLIEEAGSEEEAERLLNQILAQTLEMVEEEKKQKEEEARHEAQLIDYYISLDKYLFATLNRNVEIGITNGLVGQEPNYCNYELVNYVLNKRNNYLKLELVRNGEIYPITFYEIMDIKYSDLRHSLKTWIYMPNAVGTWRFYLSYNDKILSGALKNNKFDSGRLELK